VWLTWKSATLADSEVRLTQVMEVGVMALMGVESAAVCQQGLPSQPPSQGVRELAAARTPGGIAFKLVSRVSSPSQTLSESDSGSWQCRFVTVYSESVTAPGGPHCCRPRVESEAMAQGECATVHIYLVPWHKECATVNHCCRPRVDSEAMAQGECATVHIYLVPWHKVISVCNLTEVIMMALHA
jgi:hypothetical protein